MPSSETLELSGVPVLLHSPANRDRPAPLILLWHGFGIPNSEAALADALPLEQVDAWKAYLGLPLFGQRFPGTEEIMRRQMEDYVLNLLLPVMEQAMQELPRVFEALQWHCNLASDTPVGLFGFSAGGLAALLTLAESDLPIQAAILVGVTKNLSAAVATFERYSQAMSSILKQQFPWVKPEQLTYTWSSPSEAARDRLDFVSRAGEIAQGTPLPPAILLMHAAQDEAYDVGDAEILYIFVYKLIAFANRVL